MSAVGNLSSPQFGSTPGTDVLEPSAVIPPIRPGGTSTALDVPTPGTVVRPGSSDVDSVPAAGGSGSGSAYDLHPVYPPVPPQVPSPSPSPKNGKMSLHGARHLPAIDPDVSPISRAIHSLVRPGV